ncbi:protein translocase subunit SecD [Streptomyces huiliensis]|uniref:protein translocase subunit SecD n=1 Tax=Streptomyces huiliensis TaxID=2876027 RepID=UPI001CC0FC4B|nr:protein translocase subunit SecD [Streptomyces huiliensis]MBZ4321862.1 protein translocase subunit SecD [Streptomyces huiliensis]
MAAPKKGRRSPGGQGRPGRVLAFILIAMVALVGGMFASGQTTPRLGIDLAGGTSFTLEAKNTPGQPNAITTTNMNTAAGIIERRVNGLGVTESEVQTQGKKHIIVNIPKGTNAKQAREQVGTTAQLTFRPVIVAAPAGKLPEPTPSASAGTGKDKGDKSKDKAKDAEKDKKDAEKGKPSGTPTASAPGSSATPSGSHTQGRAVTEALKAPQAPKPPTPSPKPSGGAANDLQKQFAALDCSTKEARSQAAKQAGRAKDTDEVVVCDKDGQEKLLLGPVAVKGVDVTEAKAALDTQRATGWQVQLKFNGSGAKKFADITGKLAAKPEPQNRFAIVMDNQAVSAPSVRSAIPGGSAEISGNFDQSSADDLANMLSYGALPLSFDVVTETTVSAALGGEQLRAGLIAGAIGLALVVIYLVVYYRGLALVALASLAASAVLTYTIMVLLGKAIGFALNLPAVCGAIVAIGITADSFIVYFERVRDEIRDGRSLRPAVERGWPRARRTILVSDFVSFLAAAVLFIVTVGKVQGFAFTLGLTTLLDVVVVFFFTKPLMTLLARRKFFASGHPWSGLDPKRLGAKPPLRASRRRPSAPVDPKEA